MRCPGAKDAAKCRGATGQFSAPAQEHVKVRNTMTSVSFLTSPYKPIFTSNPVFLFLFFGRLLPVNIGLFLKPEALNIPLLIRSVVILSLSFPTPPPQYNPAGD